MLRFRGSPGNSKVGRRIQNHRLIGSGGCAGLHHTWQRRSASGNLNLPNNIAEQCQNVHGRANTRRGRAPFTLHVHLAISGALLALVSHLRTFLTVHRGTEHPPHRCSSERCPSTCVNVDISRQGGNLAYLASISRVWPTLEIEHHSARLYAFVMQCCAQPYQCHRGFRSLKSLQFWGQNC